MIIKRVILLGRLFVWLGMILVSKNWLIFFSCLNSQIFIIIKEEVEVGIKHRLRN